MRIIVLSIVLGVSALFGNHSRGMTTSLSKGDTFACVSQEELILFRMVNDMRMVAKMPALKLSPALCVVARTHLNDLVTWMPMKEGCGLQSWSNKGLWTPCCYNKDPKASSCMNDKPREITNYQGNGYEIIYWDEETFSPASAIKAWTDYPASRDLIINKAAWSKKNWQVVGVATGKGFAILWFGELADNTVTVRLCESDSVVSVAALSAINQEKPVSVKNPQSQQKGQVAETVGKPAPMVSPSAKPAEPPQKQLSQTTPSVTPSVKPTETPQKQPSKPESSRPVLTSGSVEATQGMYFLIVSNLGTEQAASQQLEKLKKQGYTNSGYLSESPRFRVYVDKFNTEEQAQNEKEKLKASFPGIWVLKPR